MLLLENKISLQPERRAEFSRKKLHFRYGQMKVGKKS